jgi:RHS repeat-associated protein
VSGGYRFGFQNQEKDDEIKGEGNSVNYLFRMHDPRLGRFFAVDPLSQKYLFNSPYCFSGNKLIAWAELEGLEDFFCSRWYIFRAYRWFN